MGENMNQRVEVHELSPSAPPQIKRSRRASRAPKAFRRNSKVPAIYNLAATWAVQCIECRKWRVIPTEQEYEEIRKNISENPFTCKRKDNVSCNDSADLEYGSKHLWVLDRPNLPPAPSGFKRTLTLRKDFSRLDCFYETEHRKKLRAPSEVAVFLSEHPEYTDVSAEDFSFRAPRIAKETMHLAGYG